jgi:regulator of sirC expression with transglutaminase-like and TPR domain
MGDYPMALQDLERYLASTEPAGDSEAVRTLIARIQARIAR